VILGAVLAAVLWQPASSLAGSFSWDQPANFTTTGQGANPDHDSYGATPWSYVDAPDSLGTVNPSSFQRLPSFSTSTRGGLVGWSDPAAAATLVGTDPGSTPITTGGDVFTPGRLVMTPDGGRAVAVAWTSPLSHTATVSLSGSVTAADAGLCPSTYTATLDQAGQPSVALGNGPFSASAAVPAGGTIYLTIHPPALALSADCDTALVALHIGDTETSGPTVTLDDPANGGVITGGQPSFSGHASTASGTSSTVTVRVYSGNSTAGAPVQTLTTTRAGDGSYKVSPSPPLGDGTYTAQAEQDDAASPPDAGLSNASTFVVHNAAPTIKLSSLGSGPLHTSTPTLQGVAGTAAGDTRAVAILVYAGASTDGSAPVYQTGAVDARGAFSIKLAKPLRDGQYTAVAAQNVAGVLGLSNPVTFRIKVHAPTVTVTRPANRSHTGEARPLLSGRAGNVIGDSATLTLTLRAGHSLRGPILGRKRTRRRGGSWLARWQQRLKLGLYTLQVAQADDAGHTGTARSTFRIVPAPTVIGASVKITPGGLAEVPITCVVPAGVSTTCTGQVLVLTVDSLEPVAGGPIGPVRVLYAFVSIPAGRTDLVRRRMPPYVTRILRRGTKVKVRVSTRLTPSGRATAIRTLQIAR